PRTRCREASGRCPRRPCSPSSIAAPSAPKRAGASACPSGHCGRAAYPCRVTETDSGEEVWGRLRKKCPHCGAWSQTLGSVCSECGKSFTPLGLLDRIPFPGNDTLTSAWAGPLYLLAGI